MENNRFIVVLGNGNDWCETSLIDFNKIPQSKVVNTKFPCSTTRLVNKMLSIHFSERLNRKCYLPFQKIWFHKFVKHIHENRNDEIIIVIYDRNKLANNIPFLKYLRKYYNNCKLVYVFTNIVKISGATNNNFVNKLNMYYDVVYAFDPSDAPKYNFHYHPLLYSKVADEKPVKEKKQVFYVGKAKDRYQMLVNVYERLEKLNVHKNFYIFGVEDDKQVYNDKIKYNNYIPYSECIKNIKESNCLLDIIQGESEGFTIKVCEAVMYDKLLITTNTKVVDAPFYNPDYILVIRDENDITKEFFDNKKVAYSKEGKEVFSVETFVKHIYKDLF